MKLIWLALFFLAFVAGSFLLPGCDEPKTPVATPKQAEQPKPAPVTPKVETPKEAPKPTDGIPKIKPDAKEPAGTMQYIKPAPDEPEGTILKIKDQGQAQPNPPEWLPPSIHFGSAKDYGKKK